MRNKLASLSILIQVYNDEKTIPLVLEEAIENGQKYAKEFELIVVDDCSKDNSWQIIKEYAAKHQQIRCVKHQKNLGFGKTIKESYYLAKNEYIFTIPGDRQIKASALSRLITKIDSCDLVVGRREKRNDVFFRKIQSSTYHYLLKLLFGLDFLDVNSSKLIRKKVIDSVFLKYSSAFVDAELCLKALRKKFCLCEIEIEHFKSSKNGGGGKLKTILPVVKDMVCFYLYKN